MLLGSMIFAQDSTQQRGPVISRSAVEAGWVAGDLYDGILDNPFQLGCRLALYGFIADDLAIGAGVRGSVFPYRKYGMSNGWSLGGGPEIVILSEGKPGEYGIFTAIHAHIIRQNIDGGTNLAGFEFGILAGGMKFYNGLAFGGGLAYAIMPNAPGGARIYITIGIASTRTKSE